MLPKSFDPQEAEPRLYTAWETEGLFKPSGDPDAKPFTIVIPPPNVTGSLHMGHALNNTLQDILVRFERMRGRDVLWQVGMDHAGIATQMVVERQLMERQEPGRREMGRDAFVDRVWAWKEESGGAIARQLRRLGASCDWSRERFTMDEGLSAAVRKTFVRLYNEGLIYRDKRLVNWDPKFQTAISDLEVENREVDGHFWHFKYPLENGETYEFPVAFDEDGKPTAWETRDYIAIATTRPETMLGDGAVAVHPDDERYKPIVGKRVLLPLAERYIPIIADEYPDPELGSGAVKITGAHDFNDFEVARRHGLPLIDIMDDQGNMAGEIPDAYQGLDRFVARERVVADIEAQGLLLQVEDRQIQQPFGDRSGVVIEPRLKDQWYVDAEKLAVPAIDAVEKGATKFVPANWSKTYFEWMRNIQPWCVSRQLWWGHRIPAWFGPDGRAFVAETEADALAQASAHYGAPTQLTQDEDVLDTWFSSALWPFATLGWPDETPELARYYQTDVLVTGFDIIFFWVARMMMMGLHFMEEPPFHTVYMHALVRDEHGQKMSKSKGNVIDPLSLIDEFGADALRFTLTAMAAQGRDIKLSKQRVEGYRNFSTKLWNAARFCEMNECAPSPGFDPANAARPLDRWIIGQTVQCQIDVTRHLEAYRFNEAAGALYQFIWGVFCDWHLELIKPVLNEGDEQAQAATRRTTGWALEQILRMLHPFMPFVTEELWGALGEGGAPRDGMLAACVWPSHPDELIDPAARDEVGWVIGLITEIRSLKAEMGLSAVRAPMALVGAAPENAERLERYRDIVMRMAGLDQARASDAVPSGAVQTVHGEATVALPLAGLVDLEAEVARLQKEAAKVDGDIAKIDAKLANEKFLARAPEAVVQEQRDRRADAAAKADKLREAIDRFRSAM